MLKPLLNWLASLKLTIVLLALGIVLVFFGTLAQVEEGLYAAQNRWFRSFVVWWESPGGGFRLPMLPGGYAVGTLLLANLIAAHASRFKFAWRKSGILLVHAGLVLLLLGQLFTDALSTESAMRLIVGESKNYSEDFHANELVIINTSDPKADDVVAIPESLVARQGEISHPSLPVKLRIKDYWPNCDLFERPPAGAKPSGATHGAFAKQLVLPLSEADTSGQRRAAVLVEILGEAGPLGTWLAPSRTEQPEQVRLGNRRWDMSLVFAPALGGHFLVLSDPGRSHDEQPEPIAEQELVPGREISVSNTPFKLRVREFWPRCQLYRSASAQAVVPEITRGVFVGLMVEPQPLVRTTDARNVPAAVVEVISGQGSLGTWLLPTASSAKQSFEWEGQSYELAMRFTRHYKPFNLMLLKATHQKYRGTEIAKDFRSRVRVEREDTGEVRETEIYMNAPLRFAGYTFFQYQMAADEMAARAGERPSSTFQVVKNPSWLTPYVSCVLVGMGLIVQFLTHLVGFIMKRKTA
jgi:hypothetical protein